jgi:hypothetical protein
VVLVRVTMLVVVLFGLGRLVDHGRLGADRTSLDAVPLPNGLHDVTGLGRCRWSWLRARETRPDSPIDLSPESRAAGRSCLSAATAEGAERIRVGAGRVRVGAGQCGSEPTPAGQIVIVAAFRSSTASTGFGCIDGDVPRRLDIVRRRPSAATGICRYVSRSDANGGGPCSGGK